MVAQPSCWDARAFALTVLAFVSKAYLVASSRTVSKAVLMAVSRPVLAAPSTSPWDAFVAALLKDVSALDCEFA